MEIDLWKWPKHFKDPLLISLLVLSLESKDSYLNPQYAKVGPQKVWLLFKFVSRIKN